MDVSHIDKSKLHTKQASAIAAIMVYVDFLEHKDIGTAIYLRKITD